MIDSIVCKFLQSMLWCIFADGADVGAGEVHLGRDDLAPLLRSNSARSNAARTPSQGRTHTINTTKSSKGCVAYATRYRDATDWSIRGWVWPNEDEA